MLVDNTEEGESSPPKPRSDAQAFGQRYPTDNSDSAGSAFLALAPNQSTALVVLLPLGGREGEKRAAHVADKADFR